ncbi:hypothetical protein D0469_11255 [Peribacillus saganii]|uniref:EfeO-type cupredoxin-like domain-containing protein n=1 Tax=Peribacillus saganii TaxID=2303992 RepID=A0A372LMY2_9BACI|nr:hypothetical protein [Peribacillus saganii]RFU68709.1 hypothetical protein D0469_11255 [Peribacillus saganii]
MKFIIIRRKWLLVGLAIVALGLSGWYYLIPLTAETAKMENSVQNFEINMVTGEYKTTTKDGKELEAYRWDPGTIFIPQDKQVNLKIFGVNGSEHPFHIEGTDIKGVVRKGKETVIPLMFKKEGTYRLICETHIHSGSGGPMIAYLVVD